MLRRALFLPSELKEVIDPELGWGGLRRLQPLRRLAASLKPDPSSDVGRVCALESANYLRNQLLRDADWAGMAHSVEIRVPLVDFTLLGRLAPVLASITPSTGKAALANAPIRALPDEILARRKSGFAVPTGAWMNAAANENAYTKQAAPQAAGLVSRRWSQTVMHAFASG